MRPATIPLALVLLTVLPRAALADAFDHYTNPVLAKAPAAPGVLEVKQLTPDELTEYNRVLPNIASAMVIVKTNGGRFAKLLVQAARRKTADDPPRQIPILLIERFVTYKEDEERQVTAQGANVTLYHGFHFSLDHGHVVPPELGGDLKFVVKEGKVHAEPVGKARLFLLTRPLPEASPKKSGKLVVGDTFEVRYFNGVYKLYDDGRRSGELHLKVDDQGEVAGYFYSDTDGQKYEVYGKVGKPNHSIHFTVKLPRTEAYYKGWMFTGNGKAIAGSASLQGRDTAFYAVRIEDE